MRGAGGGSVVRSRWGSVVRAVLGAACLLVPAWVAITRWSTLIAGHPAYPVAVAATASSPTVEVVDNPTTWELRPRGSLVDVGVVFFPGALVDPRAYLPLLRPLAEDGHLVVVVKPPFDVALLSTADAALDAHPEVTGWAVGGHSLGGVAAATQAASGDPRVRGVFFWASYPDRDLTRAPLTAASISGERDGVISQARLDQSRAQLPAGTEFTEVPGAVHAFFGDYGPQPGDGTPTASRADAQREIVAATERFLAGMAGPA